MGIGCICCDAWTGVRGPEQIRFHLYRAWWSMSRSLYSATMNCALEGSCLPMQLVFKSKVQVAALGHHRVHFARHPGLILLCGSMATSSQRPERHTQQDYIARIRYSNTLPPPPNPPKLLDIPGTGLAGSQYTSAAFASRLAREQPLNIEVDAELGMPIDLIGIPGIFDGDESGKGRTQSAPQTWC